MNLILTEVEQQAALAWQHQGIAALAEQVSVADTARFDAIKFTSVIGAGAMGKCIALALLRLNRHVTLVDRDERVLIQAHEFIKGYLTGQVEKGRLSAEACQQCLDNLHFSRDLADVSQSQLVIEAVPEILSLKQTMMQSLSEIVAPNCILATNTSTLDLDEIAGAASESSRVIGTHFFIPAHVTKLLEIVPAKVTANQVLGTVKAMALAMNKVFVIAGNCDGFIGNRLFDRFHQEAMFLLEEGATPEQVDSVLETWGMAIGPFRALDIVGNDIPWQVRLARYQRNPQLVQARMGDALCERGWFGQKTGQGWYRYEPGSRVAITRPETQQFIAEEAAALGRTVRSVTDAEILDRCLLALVNEGGAILREGFAESEQAIDLTFVNGYGFPAKFGGPMFLARQKGLQDVIDSIETYREIAAHGVTLWQPDAWLIAECAR